MGEGLSHILHLSTMIFYLLGYVQERRLFKPWIICFFFICNRLCPGTEAFQAMDYLSFNTFIIFVEFIYLLSNWANVMC